jgi:hypothetical protein
MISAEPALRAVVVRGIDAGLALREKTGFRFVAVDPRFDVLDGSRFQRLDEVEAAARRLARVVLEERAEA